MTHAAEGVAARRLHACSLRTDAPVAARLSADAAHLLLTHAPEGIAARWLDACPLRTDAPVAARLSADAADLLLTHAAEGVAARRLHACSLRTDAPVAARLSADAAHLLLTHAPEGIAARWLDACPLRTDAPVAARLPADAANFLLTHTAEIERVDPLQSGSGRTDAATADLTATTAHQRDGCTAHRTPTIRPRRTDAPSGVGQLRRLPLTGHRALSAWASALLWRRRAPAATSRRTDGPACIGQLRRLSRTGDRALPALARRRRRCHPDRAPARAGHPADPPTSVGKPACNTLVRHRALALVAANGRCGTPTSASSRPHRPTSVRKPRCFARTADRAFAAPALWNWAADAIHGAALIADPTYREAACAEPSCHGPVRHALFTACTWRKVDDRAGPGANGKTSWPAPLRAHRTPEPVVERGKPLILPGVGHRDFTAPARRNRNWSNAIGPVAPEAHVANACAAFTQCEGLPARAHKPFARAARTGLNRAVEPVAPAPQRAHQIALAAQFRRAVRIAG